MIPQRLVQQPVQQPVQVRPLPHRRMAPWAAGVVHALQLPTPAAQSAGAPPVRGKYGKTFKLPPAPVDVVAAMVDKSFTTDDSAAASAAASATASASPSPSASPYGTLGGGGRTRLTATNSSGGKRRRTM